MPPNWVGFKEFANKVKLCVPDHEECVLDGSELESFGLKVAENQAVYLSGDYPEDLDPKRPDFKE